MAIDNTRKVIVESLFVCTEKVLQIRTSSKGREILAVAVH